MRVETLEFIRVRVDGLRGGIQLRRQRLHGAGGFDLLFDALADLHQRFGAGPDLLGDVVDFADHLVLHVLDRLRQRLIGAFVRLLSLFQRRVDCLRDLSGESFFHPEHDPGQVGDRLLKYPFERGEVGIGAGIWRCHLWSLHAVLVVCGAWRTGAAMR